MYIEGLPLIVGDSATALLDTSSTSGMTLLSLVLLALFHPIVDIVNWQRIAVFAKDPDWSPRDGERGAAFKSFCATYAIEVPLIALFVGLFGAIAGLTLETTDRANVVQTFVAGLIEQDNLVATMVALLFLFGLLAMTTATISALFAAGLCAFHYDIMPVVWPASSTPLERAGGDAQTERRTWIVAAAIGLVVCAAFYLADAWFEITFASGRFLALVLGCSSLQLALVPLVCGALIAKSTRLAGPGWALAIMGVGAATAIGTTAAYLSTGYDLWQWATVPACLGSGAVIFAIASSRKDRP
jgi:hypothetical protein